MPSQAHLLHAVHCLHLLSVSSDVLMQMLAFCCGDPWSKVHAADLGRPHEAALQAAEAIIVQNAHINVTDVYSLAAPVGHGAFAKVVECTHKVPAASVAEQLQKASIHDASTQAIPTCWKSVGLLPCDSIDALQQVAKTDS